MSLVTNVVLKTAVQDAGLIGGINSALKDKGFVSCDDESLPFGWYAGTKALECEIFPGAFNYLDLDAMIYAIRTVPWDQPGSVQLFIQEQNEDRLREVDLGLITSRHPALHSSAPSSVQLDQSQHSARE